MQVHTQELELKESIKYLDANQKKSVLLYVREQLINEHRSKLKKEALREIRWALK